ncbi:hypothetical protein PsalMR5_01285 [Piscirickettsia salmonis]|uniref:hypothetical protein n=1 Tax=Piscirickettsia salmonis TaxID=1238 RepID=UPI0012BAE70B|nr:hypothetical protein [Piscirickettsia salmonis]QGP53851.1 hypothetical protein PsalSR1_01275 [Piscirickettsia salmonis]QGP60252.1 hypothetical protein PsalBI1_02857 [Piscirickettsia salmonis]QGP63429.1 hypothetical protein PsalMR5_01285 [Piscirickettsia salmonis]
MPMPASHEIKKQYLIFLAEACADPEDSVLCRSSIKDKAENSSGFKEIERFFLDDAGTEIEEEFKQLKENLSKCSDIEEKDTLLVGFNNLFEKKTEHTIDIARILGFSQSENLPPQALRDMLLLDAINFKASSKLREYFIQDIVDTMDPTKGDSDGSAFKTLDKSFKDVEKDLFGKLDLSCHPDLFKQLIDLDLGNQPDYILAMLNKPQQFQTLNNELGAIYQDTKTHAGNAPAPGTIASFFSCLWPKQENFENHFNLYKSNVLKSFYDFSLPEGQSQELLKSQLAQHETQFLTASGLANSDPECKVLSQRLLNSLGIQDAQPSPSSPLLFSQQQVAAAHSTAPTPEPSPY